MTTASEAAGKQGVESKAKALDIHVVNGDSTVATNLAVLNDDLGPVASTGHGPCSPASVVPSLHFPAARPSYRRIKVRLSCSRP